MLVHESEFCQSNAVVVRGRDGVLLIDPGVQDHEMACLANDLSESGQTVVALRLLEGVAGDVDVDVPGHGSVGGADQTHARIERDRAYVLALREGRAPDDPRIGASAKPGWEWVSDVHDGQAQRLARRSERDGGKAEV